MPNTNLALAEMQNVQSAKLPALYSNAVEAISQCSQMDECQSWANKAEAMASYARQASDDRMRRMADRIQARAIRRCGELLKQIPDTNRGRPAKNIREGAHTNISRSEAAEQAGLSTHQRVTAIRVATVPVDEFEAAVESDTPPTVTALAEAGKQAKPKPKPLVDLGGIDPKIYPRATEARGSLSRFADFCAANDPAEIAKAFHPHEIAPLRKWFGAIDNWLDTFVESLPSG